MQLRSSIKSVSEELGLFANYGPSLQISSYFDQKSNVERVYMLVKKSIDRTNVENPVRDEKMRRFGLESKKIHLACPIHVFNFSTREDPRMTGPVFEFVFLDENTPPLLDIVADMVETAFGPSFFNLWDRLPRDGHQVMALRRGETYVTAPSGIHATPAMADVLQGYAGSENDIDRANRAMQLLQERTRSEPSLLYNPATKERTPIPRALSIKAARRPFLIE